MAIIPRGKNRFLIRIYLRRDPLTKKRIEINETVYGTQSYAQKREAILKGEKHSIGLNKHSRMTLDELIDLYLDSSRLYHREITQYRLKIQCDSYIRPQIGSFRLKDLKTSDLQKFFNFLLDPKSGKDTIVDNDNSSYGLGLAISSAHVVRAWLRTMFNFAIREKLITENPVRGVRLPAIGRSKANPFTLGEAAAFVSVKDSCWYGDAFIFQLHTGLRPEELMALIWDDIDFVKGTVRIERACQWINHKFIGVGPPKTKRGERTIDLGQAVLQLLKVHKEKQLAIIQEYKSLDVAYGEEMIEQWIKKERRNQEHLYSNRNLIFPAQDGRVPCMDRPRKAFKTMLRRAGFNQKRQKLRWYDLRHTHASILLTENVPQHEVAERLGHTVAQLQSTYAHVLQERKKIAAKLSESLVPVKQENNEWSMQAEKTPDPLTPSESEDND